MINALEENIVSLWREQGQQWLDDLPAILADLSSKWCLTNLRPVDNMSWHFIARADSAEFSAVCLKIGPDCDVLKDESRALDYFNGQGMVKLLGQDQDYNALLLKQAIPGQTLKDIASRDILPAMDTFSDIVDKLQSHALGKSLEGFNPVASWLTVFDRLPNDALPNRLIPKALLLSETLLTREDSLSVLHGDLHLDNILSDQAGWIAIDPKGIVGSKAFELAAFDFLSQDELRRNNASELFLSRVKQLALLADVDQSILLDWIFVRLVLNACWMIEDNGNPRQFLELLNLYS